MSATGSQRLELLLFGGIAVASWLRCADARTHELTGEDEGKCYREAACARRDSIGCRHRRRS